MTGKLLVTAAFLALAAPAFAQMPDKLLLIGGSANGFKGELNQYYNRFKPGVHATLQLNKERWFNSTVTLEAGNMQMQGPGKILQIPEGSNLNPVNSVETSFLSLHYDLHLNLLKTRNWIVYLSQGIGLMRFNPEDKNGNSLVENTLSRNREEEYSQVSVLFPTSLGAMYLFENGYGIAAQAGFLNPTTDYLDNLEQLATEKRSDNVLQYRFSFVVPLGFKDAVPAPEE